MTDLKAALESGDITILVWVALALGFLHTILGPDHYVPFVVWSCESLIPVMLAAWAIAGFAGSVLNAVCFSAITVVTIVATVWVLQQGVARISLGKNRQTRTTLAGVSLVLCGAAIQ